MEREGGQGRFKGEIITDVPTGLPVSHMAYCRSLGLCAGAQ